MFRRAPRVAQVLADGVLGQPRLALLDLPGRSSDHDLGSRHDDRYVERQDHSLWVGSAPSPGPPGWWSQGVVPTPGWRPPKRRVVPCKDGQQPIPDPRYRLGPWPSGHLVAVRRAHMTMGTSGAAVQPVTTEEANPDHYACSPSSPATSCRSRSSSAMESTPSTGCRRRHLVSNRNHD